LLQNASKLLPDFYQGVAFQKLVLFIVTANPSFFLTLGNEKSSVSLALHWACKHLRSGHKLFCFGQKLETVTLVENRPLYQQILKGSDDGVQHSKLLGFWTLSSIWYSKKTREHDTLEIESVSILR
jgi:hypothetical protein